MLQVAICDDQIHEIVNMSALIDGFRLKRNIELTYKTFQNPLELLNCVEKGDVYDIILMDVVMPGINGIDAAKEVRIYDKKVKIIFLTSSSDFAVQSYMVGAYFYQLKPVWKDSFFSLMDKVTFEIQRADNESLIINCQTGVSRIAISELVICEVIGHILHYRLASGKVLESAGSIKEIAQTLLQYPCFIRPHRSYLVNMDYVQNLSYQAIKLEQGLKIPIPRGKYSEIKEVFLKYAFKGREKLWN